MNIKSNISAILKELEYNSQFLNNDSLSEFVQFLLEAENHHIFLAGAGRSGIFMRAFSNRLMHLGYAVSNVGEITSPHSKPGDLLIIGSGSGETGSLVSLAEKARKNQVKIVLITMDEHSTIAKLSDCIVVLPGVSPKLNEKTRLNQEESFTSVQFGASAFEQMCMLTYDAVIMELKKLLEKSVEEMFALHADFE